MKRWCFAAFALAALAVPTLGQAQSATLSAGDLGVYERFSNGKGGFDYSQTPAMRYDIGSPAPGVQVRDYLVFAIPSNLGFTPTEAVLQIKIGDNPGTSDTGSETAAFHAVSTQLTDLLGDGNFRVGNFFDIFTDLGDGTEYGKKDFEVPVKTAPGDFVSIPLNGALPDILAAAGGKLAIGGSVTTLGATEEGYLFSSLLEPEAKLILRGQTSTTVPEPGNLALLIGVTGAGMLGCRRRSSRR